MFYTRVSSKPSFKLLHLWAHDLLAVLQYPVDSFLNLGLEGLVLGFEVDEGDGHFTSRNSRLAR